jgi:hypothetical protein
MVNGPATAEDLQLLVDAFGSNAPMEYISVLSTANGFEGTLAADHDEPTWLSFYSIEEAIEFNKAYHVAENEPDLFLAASNGGSEGYFISKHTGEWIEMPFVDLGAGDRARVEVRWPGIRAFIKSLPKA